jgi:ferrous iron transport protein B
MTPPRSASGRPYTLALIGNPNSGKSTLFNAITGSRQKVGNWPGVTVEKKTGRFRHSDIDFDIVDLPGTYSLHVSNQDDSIDQQIAQNFILNEEPDLLINIIDASSLERGLYLTTQLLNAGIPTIIVLNMMDVADEQGLHIDHYKLARNVGVPVVPVVASRKEGLGVLLDMVVNALNMDREANIHPGVQLGSEIEAGIAAISSLLPGINRLKATAILEKDDGVLALYPADTQTELLRVADSAECNDQQQVTDNLIEARYRWIADAVSDAIYRDEGRKVTLTDRLDDLLLHRWLAFPLFLGVMYLMFMFTINLGGAFVDLFDGVAGAIFVELPRQLMAGIGLPQWLIALVADGVGGGVQLVASFLPVIGTLFLFQSFLEGSGYMARAAFIMDRVMRAVGLPGKAFVPLIVGFGCNVPAVMSARALDSQNDRLITTLMAPFMSCGARLTVYILFATVFFPRNGQNIVFALYIFGMVMAIATGFLVKRRLMTRDMTPFILELPNYHIPTVRGLLLSTWHRLRGFMMRAGKAIVVVVVVLNFVNSMGTDGSFGNQNTPRSVLSNIGMTITPIFEPMGVKEENWPATVGIFSGVFAKEVVVGTLDALYSAMAEEASDDAAESSVTTLLVESFQTVPANLAALKDVIADPLGLNVGDLSDQETAAEGQGVKVDTLTLMSGLFAGTVGAIAYVLFVLLYMPCIATLGAIYKEAGAFWAFFAAAWNTAIAYGVAVLFFQVGTFAAHPGQTLLWSLGVIAAWTAGYFALMAMAQRNLQHSQLIPAVNLYD